MKKQNKKFYRLERTIWFKSNDLVYGNLFKKKQLGQSSNKWRLIMFFKNPKGKRIWKRSDNIKLRSRSVFLESRKQLCEIAGKMSRFVLFHLSKIQLNWAMFKCFIISMTVGIQLLCYGFHWTTEIWKLLLDHVKGLLKYSWMGPTAHICFSGCSMGTKNLHFKQVPKWCRCSWSGDRTLKASLRWVLSSCELYSLANYVSNLERMNESDC